MHDIHHGVFTKSRKSQSLKLGNLLEPTEEEPFFTTYIAQSSFKSSCIMIRVEGVWGKHQDLHAADYSLKEIRIQEVGYQYVPSLLVNL